MARQLCSWLVLVSRGERVLACRAVRSEARGLLCASRMVVHRVLVGVVVCACEHAERGGRRVPPLCGGKWEKLSVTARCTISFFGLQTYFF